MLLECFSAFTGVLSGIVATAIALGALKLVECQL